MGRRFARDGAVGLGAASAAWFVAEAARAGDAASLVWCCAACVLAVATVEVPGLVRRRVEAVQAAMFAEVVARLRNEGNRRGTSPGAAGPSGVAGAREREVSELRALAEEGRAVRVRLGDWRRSETPLGDDMARAVALWERRARWALRGHRVEWAAFGAAAGQDQFAVTVGGARESVAAHVELLLSVADDLNTERRLGGP